MPVYVYKSDDGEVIELQMLWKEAKEKKTLKRNGKIYKRIMQPFSSQFLGSGFHCNDYSK